MPFLEFRPDTSKLVVVGELLNSIQHVWEGAAFKPAADALQITERFLTACEPSTPTAVFVMFGRNNSGGLSTQVVGLTADDLIVDYEFFGANIEEEQTRSRTIITLIPIAGIDSVVLHLTEDNQDKNSDQAQLHLWQGGESNMAIISIPSTDQANHLVSFYQAIRTRLSQVNNGSE